MAARTVGHAEGEANYDIADYFLVFICCNLGLSVRTLQTMMIYWVSGLCVGLPVGIIISVNIGWRVK